jgi:hypothetical protein
MHWESNPIAILKGKTDVAKFEMVLAQKEYLRRITKNTIKVIYKLP